MKHGSCEEYVVRRTSETTTIYFTCVQYCILLDLPSCKSFQQKDSTTFSRNKKGTMEVNTTLLLNFLNVLMKSKLDDG